MKLDDWRIVFIASTLILILLVFAPVFGLFLPKSGEKFLALAVLGEGGMAENYYPNDDPELEVGEKVHWSIYMYNHMGSVQYVAVRCKLIDSTISSPNSTSCDPFPVSHIYEIRKIMNKNETWLYPLEWSLAKVTEYDGQTSIEGVNINGIHVDTDAASQSRYNFRMAMELWVYDSTEGRFEFGWKAGEERRCAWNQIWYNATYDPYGPLPPG
ncbi:Protein of unknown function (DUF1616) [Thaumarchaeota archaeon SCGC AB-539-E09]|nr:Protein of unknown function (DUF1616) [Thaumarchaeota archaeon SCGC AB-539-E09]